MIIRDIILVHRLSSLQKGWDSDKLAAICIMTLVAAATPSVNDTTCHMLSMWYRCLPQSVLSGLLVRCIA